MEVTIWTARRPRPAAYGRPAVYGGYEYSNPVRVQTRHLISVRLQQHIAHAGAPNQVLAMHGAAIGGDTDVDNVAISLGIPRHWLIPFPGQESRWPSATKSDYYARRDTPVCQVTTCYPRVPDNNTVSRLMHARNKAMGDEAKRLQAEGHNVHAYAIWDGRKSGGTWNAMLSWMPYFPITVIDINTFEVYSYRKNR